MNMRFMCSTDWCAETPDEETIKFLLEAARPHVEQAGPYREDLEEILGSRDWTRLVNYSVNYGVGTPDSLYHTRQALAFFQKLECLPLGVDKERVAWESFQAAERSCFSTNLRLRESRLDGSKTPSNVASVLLTAQRKIARILGDVPSLADLQIAYGPGACTTVKARTSSARWKLDAQPACSTNLVPILEPVLRNIPHYAYEHRVVSSDPLLNALEDHMDNYMVPVIITDGLLQFVPKSAKTHRSIVVEPLLNSLYQKGIGVHIRRRLRSAGLDIRSQSDLNKRLAQRASIDQSLATIDLSAASDTISYEVVSELLPLDWFSFLCNFRTSSVSYKGNRIALQKFSSMGNGFTFELETLLFWALARSCCAILQIDESECYSYGDDIIIPSGAVELLYQVLSFCGFSVNSEKSFIDGPFRESCGGDFINGYDIRPFYQKDRISGLSLFALHNFYMRSLYFDFARRILECIPPTLRIFGPDGYGDGHLIGDWHKSARPYRRDRGWSGVLFDTFTLRKKTIKRRLRRGDRILPLYTIYVQSSSEAPTDHYAVRGSKGYKRISLYTLSDRVFSV